MSHPQRLSILRGATVAFAASMVVACGGGGNGSSGGANPPPTGGGNPPPASPTTGTVAVVLRDFPNGEFCRIYADIERIELFGQDGPTTLVEYVDPADDGRFELLALRNQSELVTVAAEVPIGDYEKIRLTLDQLSLVECPDGDPELEQYWEHPKIPGNGKLDLIPRGGLQVIGGETLLVELDMDMNKSLHLHQTGQGNGKWQFRPVVFVTVTPDSNRLVRIYGEISGFVDVQSPFELCPIDTMASADDGSDMSEDDYSRRCVDVFLRDGSNTRRIFDDKGDAVGPGGILVDGVSLTAIGFLGLHDDDDDDSRRDDLRLNAVVLHVGDPVYFKTLIGSVATQLREPANFLFDADETSDSAADLIDVAYQGGPILDLGDSSSETDTTVILPGAGLEVNGVFTRVDSSNPGEPPVEGEPLKATLILLQAPGELALASMIGGSITTVEPDDDDIPATRRIGVTVEGEPEVCVRTVGETRYLVIEETETLTTTTEITFDVFFGDNGDAIDASVDVFGTSEVVDGAPTGCIIADTIQQYVTTP